jgi:hypothetical protein
MNRDSQQKIIIFAEIWCVLQHVLAKFVTDRSFLNTISYQNGMFTIKVPPVSLHNTTDIMIRSLKQVSTICLWRKYPLLRFGWMQSDNQYSRYSKATSCVAATSVHALPCACRRLAFLCPTWQRPASSTMASLRVRSLFLLENSALKFDGSGVGRRSQHDIFQSRYQLRGFYHLHNELRKNPTQCFEHCRTLPSTFDYIQRAIQHIIYSRLYSTFHTAQQIFRKQCLWK